MQFERLRNYVTIEQRADTLDGNGNTVTVWSTFLDDVPADIRPLSARDRVAAAAAQSEVTAQVVLRYVPGIVAESMRLRREDGRLYHIAGVVDDPKSGYEWMTLLCTQGVRNG